MYYVTRSKQLHSFDGLSPLEQSQITKAVERLWGEELSPEEAFAFDTFGAGCVIQYIDKDDVPAYELWFNGGAGVLFDAGTDRLAPMAMIQHGIVSLVQGFEEVAAGLNQRQRRLSLSGEHLIREVRESDAAPIVAILEEIIAARRFTIMRSISLEEQLAYIRSFPARGVFLVAEQRDSGRVVGLQSIEPYPAPTQQHIAEISTFVSLSETKRHIGQTLMLEMKQRARAMGFRKIVASVRTSNRGALQFYQAQGFRLLCERAAHHLLDGEYTDESLLELTL